MSIIWLQSWTQSKGRTLTDFKSQSALRASATLLVVVVVSGVVSVYPAYVRWWNLLCKDKHMWNYWSGRANSLFRRFPPFQLVDRIKDVNEFLTVSSCLCRKCRKLPASVQNQRLHGECVSFCSASWCVEIQQPSAQKCYSLKINSDWRDSLTLDTELLPFIDPLERRTTSDTRHVGVLFRSSRWSWTFISCMLAVQMFKPATLCFFSM